MKITKININNINNFKCNSINYNYNFALKKILNNQLDSQDSISFTGLRKSKKEKRKNIADVTTDCGIAGMSFLLSLTTSIALTKMGNKATNILYPDSGFKVREDGITSKFVNIDTDDHKIEFKGTGIEIKTNEYDHSDWAHGVFKNYDGSVDIDLENNKFIDVKNGIFIDPAHKISAVIDGNYKLSLYLIKVRQL